MRLFGGRADRSQEGPDGAFGVATEAILQRLSGVESGIQELRDALHPLKVAVAVLNEDRDKVADFAHETRTNLEAQAGRIGDLTVALSEGIAKVERHEARIRATVRRAREELEDSGIRHPGLEAEAAQLSLVDGAGGGAGRMPEVSDDVAEADLTDLPGSWEAEDVAALFGRGA